MWIFSGLKEQTRFTYPARVDSRYFKVQGTLWNTSRYPYLDISDLQNGGKINRTTTFHKWICNLTPDVRDILKILWKEEKLLFSTIFCYLLLDFHVKLGTRFSLRDKWLFEISEVVITRVDCSYNINMNLTTSALWAHYMDSNYLRLERTKMFSLR